MTNEKEQNVRPVGSVRKKTTATVPMREEAQAVLGRDVGTFYLSGRTSGLDLCEVRATFFNERNRVRWKGYRIISPLRMRLCRWLSAHGHHRTSLLVRLFWLAYAADAICMLPGWGGDKEARAEKALAEALGKPVCYSEKKTQQAHPRPRRPTPGPSL